MAALRGTRGSADRQARRGVPLQHADSHRLLPPAAVAAIAHETALSVPARNPPQGSCPSSSTAPRRSTTTGSSTTSATCVRAWRMVVTRPERRLSLRAQKSIDLDRDVLSFEQFVSVRATQAMVSSRLHGAWVRGTRACAAAPATERPSGRSGGAGVVRGAQLQGHGYQPHAVRCVAARARAGRGLGAHLSAALAQVGAVPPQSLPARRGEVRWRRPCARACAVLMCTPNRRRLAQIHPDQSLPDVRCLRASSLSRCVRRRCSVCASATTP